VRDLNEIQCFVKAVELKSLTAAARALDLPKSSVSRKISNLEKRLGVTLIVRTTRALNLTDAGRGFFHTAISALHELESAEKGLDKSRQRVDGLLRITAPADFAIGPFPKLIAAFLKEYPLVSIELVFTERVVDLISESMDLAFRLGALKDSTLMAKKLKPFNAQIFASPEYLKMRGEPKTITDIEEQEWVRFTPDGVPMKWALKSPEGKRVVTPRGRLSANHSFALKQAAIDGLGFAVIANFMIEDEIKNRKLKVVCPSWQVHGDSAHIVFPAQRFLSPKLRHFIDFAAAHFAI
jgi:DNA-binding transcriptional LysR family regulator